MAAPMPDELPVTTTTRGFGTATTLLGSEARATSSSRSRGRRLRGAFLRTVSACSSTGARSDASCSVTFWLLSASLVIRSANFALLIGPGQHQLEELPLRRQHRLHRADPQGRQVRDLLADPDHRFRRACPAAFARSSASFAGRGGDLGPEVLELLDPDRPTPADSLPLVLPQHPPRWQGSDRRRRPWRRSGTGRVRGPRARRCQAWFQRSSSVKRASVVSASMSDQLDAGHLGEVLEHLGRRRRGAARCGAGRRRSARPRPRWRGPGAGSQTARATGSLGSGSSGSTTSTSLATSRNRSPMSQMPTTTPGPGAALKTSRTGSSRPPMPSGWISQRRRAAGDASGRPRACGRRGSSPAPGARW